MCFDDCFADREPQPSAPRRAAARLLDTKKSIEQLRQRGRWHAGHSIVDGQTHGGIAMGIGQTLYEQLHFDRESGQVMGGTFMEYAVPRSFQVPRYDVELREHPTAGNPLRVKGGGEGGVTPAPAAIIGAICDALRDYGVDHIETPATSEKIWRAMHRTPAELRIAQPAGATRL